MTQLSTTNRTPIIGVMGGAVVSDQDYRQAFELGEMIADNGWILLNGGRDAGIMRVSAEGAKKGGGWTIGILPGDSKNQANPFIDIPIVTHLADARNLINILSSDVVVACPGSAGTLTKVALALKNSIPLIAMNFKPAEALTNLADPGLLILTSTPTDTITAIKNFINFAVRT